MPTKQKSTDPRDWRRSVSTKPVEQQQNLSSDKRNVLKSNDDVDIIVMIDERKH